MTKHNLETTLFAQAIQRVQFNFKILDLQLDERNSKKSIWEFVRFRWLFWFNMALLNFATVGEIAWLVEGVSTGKSLIELCYLGPCLTLCIACNFLCTYFVKHSRRILELIASIRTLQSMSAELEETDVKFLKSQVKIFYIAVYTLTATQCVGITLFGLIPFVTMCLSYYHSGEVELVLPFFVLYPFDTTDIRFWPIAYIQEMWGALLACLILLAPSYLLYACSTFIIFQFHLLKKDLRNIIPYEDILDKYVLNEDLKTDFKKIINRHRKLIECVDLLKEAYSESNLLNVVMSSILICFTGFNVMAIEDLAMAVPFLPFLLMDMLQIFFICYYGDMIMRYSSSISDAIYECQWYRAEAAIVKDLLFLSLRSQKPCKLTALHFSDINFKTFTKILSTSWSYFALLKSMYRS
ncbi:putative odorant receptor 92a isoform X1 [Maniola hyperantus]|uniref:putative odorant receptor 92a isoform X1 n=1 Tax=Aphantopus hyperantus TaxID=2795564 RepID=UPI00156923E3|nr:putative odorant receptor 92a [Maniola hyperantus]